MFLFSVNFYIFLHLKPECAFTNPYYCYNCGNTSIQAVVLNNKPEAAGMSSVSNVIEYFVLKSVTLVNHNINYISISRMDMR